LAVMTKRYLMFRGDVYYPLGGWSDFVGAFDSVDAALEENKRFPKPPGHWFQIVDLLSMLVVKGAE
jgi:hypothetical protein